MASVITNLMTADEFYEWTHRPENRDRHFELERGEVVEVSRPGKKHCLVCGHSCGILWTYSQQHNNCNVYPNDLGFVLERDPDTVRGADVAVYLESISYEDQEIKYSERVPNLAVEVLSPNDRFGKMQKRIEQFLAKGVGMVWLVDPDSETITVYLPGQLSKTLDGNDEVTGESVLPDFRCKVAKFFKSAGK
jgi:Uma2 family endonuclease